MKRSFPHELAYWLKVVSLGLVVGLSIQFAQAWTSPTVAPPGGNVAGPITVGIVDQIKSASLGIVNHLVVGATGGLSNICLNGSCITAWPSGSNNQISAYSSPGTYTIDTTGAKAIYIANMCGAGGGGSAGSGESGGEVGRAGAFGYDGECVTGRILVAGAEFTSGDKLTIKVGTGGYGADPEKMWNGSSWVYKRQASVGQPGGVSTLSVSSTVIKMRGGQPGQVDNCNTDGCKFAGATSTEGTFCDNSVLDTNGGTLSGVCANKTASGSACYFKPSSDIIGQDIVTKGGMWNTLGYCGPKRLTPLTTCSTSFTAGSRAPSGQGGSGGAKEEQYCGGGSGSRGQDGGNGSAAVIIMK